MKLRIPAVLVLCATGATLPSQEITTRRPFGTLREQAAMQQRWLQQRMDSVLPALMREYGVELWVLSMREYGEDPVFWSIAAPTTFALAARLYSRRRRRRPACPTAWPRRAAPSAVADGRCGSPA